MNKFEVWDDGDQEWIDIPVYIVSQLNPTMKYVHSKHVNGVRFALCKDENGCWWRMPVDGAQHGT